MPASLTEIREGLAEALSAVAGMQVSAWMLSNPTPPAAHVYPDETEYHRAMQNGAEGWTLIVEAFVASNSEIGAQQRLDKMLASSGAESVKEALEADGTLGGIVSDVTVTRTTGYRQYQLPAGQGPALGAQWTVEVLV